jgi:hypothetical protein
LSKIGAEPFRIELDPHETTDAHRWAQINGVTAILAVLVAIAIAVEPN